jgi:multiple sugar transport system permease protein
MSEDNRAITSVGSQTLLTSFTAAVVAVWLFPVLWMILTSFKPGDQIASRVPILVFDPTLEHYHILMNVYHFGRMFQTSLLVAALTTIVALILACPAAYALGCIEFRRSKDIALWILSQRMLPPVAVIIPFFIFFRRTGLIDTAAGLVIVNLVQALPFAIWLLRGFFLDVPHEVREAAVLDRLAHWQILMRIVAPIAAPSIAVTAIFTFIYSWNEFLFALFLTAERSTTAPVGVSQLILAYQVLWGEVSAAGSLALLPLIPIVLYMQRHIVRGMTLGAVK